MESKLNEAINIVRSMIEKLESEQAPYKNYKDGYDFDGVYENNYKDIQSKIDLLKEVIKELE